MNRLSLLLKRIFDVLASLTLIILLSPLFGLIIGIIWIKLGRPVIFRQQRLGLHGKEFTYYKFRTMTDDRDAEGNLLPDEERMTIIGKLLRSTSLDELPGLMNVLTGQMSAVGPRPLLVEYRDLYTKEQWRRHDMLPGMAGPVLASGRNILTWEEKFEQDLYYIYNWSLWLDFKILANSILGVLKREGINADQHVTMPKFTGTDNTLEEV